MNEAIKLLREYLELPCAIFVDEDIESHKNLRIQARKLIPELENIMRQEEKTYKLQ